ncbi:Na+/H+ antiporter subunit E [Mesorhizobium sp.]|uniref:Na+/H+ antiporter subunit E n=1 Tax=Mesorhizobium sp. TaxID=1871066 RepID=UPI00120A0B40|nr:Na+/H+ antiporter subunit E [Mesorhizobium sp.]TIP09236.1 MAG: Na+/H+ antiporter subunit E [Mesorhizobium sp.]
MLTRLVPHPLLTMLITVVWVLLNNDVSIAQAVIGLVLGLLVPKATSAYWPGRPRMRAPLVVIEYLLIVLCDIVVSNMQVAYLVLFRRGDQLRTRYITVPLVLTTPEAITVLAGTITMTPGTVTADVSADGRALLVHCLETDDPEATIARIKKRYEQRLKRIFA